MTIGAHLQSIHRPSPLKAELRGEISAKQPPWLTEAVAVSVHGARGRVKAIAAALGVRESAVYEAADINDPTALKAWWIPTICRETDSFTVLDAIERQVGRVAFAIPQGTPEQRDVVTQTSRVLTEVGEAVADVADAIADGTVTRLEADRFAKKADEAIAALASLRALIQQKAGGQ